MKKFLLVTIPIVMLTAACALCAVCFARPLPDRKEIKGSGHIVTKEIPAPEFDAISVSRAVHVILAEQGDKIRIDADDNLMEWVVVQAEDQELRITIDPEIKNVRNMEATVTVPVGNRMLCRLEASSASKIRGEEVELKSADLQVKASGAAEIETSVKARSCDIDASSAATVKAAVKAATCDIDASSAATVRAEVKAQACTADTSSAAGIVLKGGTNQFEGSSSSAGKINAAELITKCADVRASSGSSISVNCIETLKAQASSGAKIRYQGECKVEASKSSGGSIRKN